MALSLWDPTLQHFNPDMLSFHHPAADFDFNFCSFNNNDFDFSDAATMIDNYDINDPSDRLFYTDSYTNLLPYFSSPSENLISLSPEIFPLEDFESYQYYPKRQKSFENDVHHLEPVNFAPNIYSGCVSNVPPPAPEFFPEIPAPPLPEAAAGGFSCGMSDNQSVKKASGASLSVQSIAARERRRKITEKTQELGKLIPGGHRMNTAEMFQAASKYVKFLQAQVKILQLIKPMQEREQQFHSQELETLLESPIIQEKLYSVEKCLIPKELVQSLANDPEIQSKPVIFESIDQLLETNGD